MDLTFISLMALAMIAAGIGFIYYIVHRNEPKRPKDAVEWTGVVLSALLVVAAASLLVMISRMDAPPSAEITAEQADDGLPSLTEDELNAPAADFPFRLVADGEETSLAAYEGKVVVLNFWATWCAPCLMEMPDLNRLQADYADEGLVVLTISDEDRETLQAFGSEMIPLETVSGYVESTFALPQPYQRTIAVRPTTYIIDREGVVREFLVGMRTYDAFARLVAPYLS